MKPIRLSLLAMLALASAAGCSSTYRVVHVPQYGADLYPVSQTRAGITVAIDDMTSAERVERLFGANLVKAGVLPVNVVVSNFGKQRVLVKPSDILLYQGREVIDPVPVEMVMDIAKRQKSFLRDSTAAEVDRYFKEQTFAETTLQPNETYRGIVFFAVPGPKSWTDRWFKSSSVYRDGGPKVRIGMTSVDSGERVLFSPFQVKMPENAGRFSY